jgi:hypothetical protein
MIISWNIYIINDIILYFVFGVLMLREQINPSYTENEPDLWIEQKTKKYLTSLSWPFSGT